MLIYECENCEAELTAGLMKCPQCGDEFDEPVPGEEGVLGPQSPMDTQKRLSALLFPKLCVFVSLKSLRPQIELSLRPVRRVLERLTGHVPVAVRGVTILCLGVLILLAIGIHIGTVLAAGSAAIPRAEWVVSASGGRTPYNAIDGNATDASSWTDTDTGSQGPWLDVDMGRSWSFNRIVLNRPLKDSPQQCKVYTSQDGTNWGRPVAEGTASPGVATIAFAHQQARWIRVLFLHDESQNQALTASYTINELNVYNDMRWLGAEGANVQHDYQQLMSQDAAYSARVAQQSQLQQTQGGPFQQALWYNASDAAGRYHIITSALEEKQALALAKAHVPSMPIAAHYAVADIGNFNDDFTYHSAGANTHGQITGSTIQKGDGAFQAFLWQAGVKTNIAPLPGYDSSISNAINDQAQVVGYCYRAGDPKDPWWYWPAHAFVWQSGKISDLGTLPGYQCSAATAINNEGQIVGRCYNPGASAKNEWWAQPSHACMWDHGKVYDLGAPPGCNISRACGLNDRGQIVGWAITRDQHMHAVLWNHGKAMDLGVFPGGTVSIAQAVNNRGQIVGDAQKADGDVRACLWQNGAIYDLGTVNGSSWSKAMAINDKGQVAGWYRPLGSGSNNCFVWDSMHGIRDIDTLLTTTKLTVQRDYTIADSGQILGLGGPDNKWTKHYLLLTPLSTGAPVAGTGT